LAIARLFLLSGVAVGLLVASAAAAAEFASIGASQVNLREGPGTEHPRRWVVSRGYPVQITERDSGWAKVKDYQGDEAWVAARLLSDRRTVLVTRKLVNVRQGPSTERGIAFQAQRHVLLQYLGQEGNWVHVRHADGDEGWVYAPLVWGE
jgi:SH3-like domain-containing protein